MLEIPTQEVAMLSRGLAPYSLALAGGLALGLLAGCAPTVSRKDFDSEVARLREEMQSGDRQLGARIDSTSQVTAEHQRRLDALEKELQAMRQDFAVTIERTKGLLKFNVPVHFEFASAELREADRPVLDRFATVVHQYYPDALVTVEGFTDPAGGTAYNRRLGKRRAEAVRGYLASTGQLSEPQLRSVSYGEARERQVVPGAKGPGQVGIENRRVALVVDYAAADSTGPVAMP
jgi:peptidoglycan-associated lipoprotein